MSKNKRVLIYSHDTFGLGNIRRILAVTEHLVEQRSDVSVLIISGSPMLHAFRLKSRIDYIKLPCLHRDVDGDYGVKSLGIGLEKAVQLRSNVILNVALDFKPDLVVVDKKPAGVCRELEPTLEMLRRRSDRPRMALLLRDILDSPEITASIWQRNGYHDLIDAVYDMILVAGSKDVFDLPVAYQFPDSSIEKTRFCGYLRRKLTASTLTEECAGEEHMASVLVTAGGGEDGLALHHNYLQGLRLIGSDCDFQSVILCGPEMMLADRDKLDAAGRELKQLRFIDFTDNVPGFIDRADVVVSMGGYNSICEILAFRKRAIIVPRVRPVREQWLRAERFAELGLVEVLHPDNLSPRALITHVRSELAQRHVIRNGHYRLNLDGLPNVVHWLGELLGTTRTPVLRHARA